MKEKTIREQKQAIDILQEHLKCAHAYLKDAREHNEFLWSLVTHLMRPLEKVDKEELIKLIALN